MYLTEDMKGRLQKLGIPGLLLLKISEELHDNSSDGMSFFWRFLPTVELIPVHIDRISAMSQMVVDKCLELIQETFRVTPGFSHLVNKLDYDFFRECRQAYPKKPYDKYAKKMWDHPIKHVSEAGFWITTHPISRDSDLEWKRVREIENRTWHCARVFVAASKVVGEKAWISLDETLIALKSANSIG